MIAQRLSHFLGGIGRRAAADERGVAALEFALILPVMLTLYFGIFELSKGYMVSQRMTLVARTLADITTQVSQQPTTSCALNSGTVTLTDACMSTIFGASTAIMSPYPTANNLLTMTVSQIKFTAKSDGTCCQAKTDWTITNNGGTARPCQVLTPANAKPVSTTTVPVGLTTPPSGSVPVPNYVIVADVTYTYTPGFSFELYKWKVSKSFSMAQSEYMRPRGTYLLKSAASAGTQQCP